MRVPLHTRVPPQRIRCSVFGTSVEEDVVKRARRSYVTGFGASSTAMAETSGEFPEADSLKTQCEWRKKKIPFGK